MPVVTRQIGPCFAAEVDGIDMTRPLTTDEIKAAAGLDDATLDTALAELTQRGLLTRATADGGPVYEPANRGWSTAPEQGQGM